MKESTTFLKKLRIAFIKRWEINNSTDGRATFLEALRIALFIWQVILSILSAAICCIVFFCVGVENISNLGYCFLFLLGVLIFILFRVISKHKDRIDKNR
jgi:magnesium-transporting ATPase (P-type)